MNPFERRRLGRTVVELPLIGFGGAPLGELFIDVDEPTALATVHGALAAGIRYFDTAPWYGRGLSELRIGAGLRAEPRESFALSTKAGRWLRAAGSAFVPAPWHGGCRNEVVFDYSYDGIMRGFEQSQQRLGRREIDILWIHDLDVGYHGSGERLAFHRGALAASGWRALTELRESGLVRAIGAGVNSRGNLLPLLELVPLEAALVAMPYTLLDHEVLDDEFPALARAGAGVVIGSPFASGILALGDRPGATYDYGPPPSAIRERVRRLETVCARHGVSLAAAALAFVAAHPLVASVIPGASEPGHVTRTLATASAPIPSGLWEELRAEGLIRADAPVPGETSGERDRVPRGGRRSA